MTANLQIRSDALWVLTNLTTTPEAVNLVLQSQTKIVVNVIQEITRSHNHNSSKNKQEAILVLANIIKRTTQQDQLKYLVDQNLLDMIHNELINGGDQEIFCVIAL